MSNSFILLWLQGSLQAWGADSRFGRRDTLDFPTKSGLLGLLCCALGAGGEQRELLSEMAPLRQIVIAFKKADDRPPLLRDFHMVGSGFNAADPWETLMIPKKRDGSAPTGTGGSKMTYRYYLQDASFAVSLEVPESMAHEFSEALRFPCWDIYLGRKSCVPTDLIYRGCFVSEEEALEKAMQIATEKTLTEAFRVLDGVYEGEIVTLNDVPLQFGTRKKYRERQVTIIHKYDE